MKGLEYIMGYYSLRRVGNELKNAFNMIKEEVQSNFEVMILLFIMWIILFEEINLFVIITGLVLSVAVILFTDKFLLQGNYDDQYMIGLWQAVRYSYALVIEIFLAGWGVIPNIIKGESDVAIVTCETKLDDEFLIDILANSVTLTPGTVTIEKKGKILRILALDSEGLDESPREALPLRLEELLLEFEAKSKSKEESKVEEGI